MDYLSGESIIVDQNYEIEFVEEVVSSDNNLQSNDEIVDANEINNDFSFGLKLVPDFIVTADNSWYNNSTYVDVRPNIEESNVIADHSLGFAEELVSPDNNFHSNDEIADANEVHNDFNFDELELLLEPNENVDQNGRDTLTSPNPHTRSLRKRRAKALPCEWLRQKRSSAVVAGNMHTNHTKKIVPEKHRIYYDCSRCKFRCSKKISDEHQQLLFEEYRAIPTRLEQRLFLNYLIEDCPVRRRTVEEPQVCRSSSTAYFLKCKGETERVCQKFFCGTFGISTKIPKNIVKKRSPQSARYNGKHMNSDREPVNKTPKHKIINVKKFIASIPKMPSHYCRKESKKLYFEPTLNITKLYTSYTDEVGKTEAVSYFVFRSIFREWDPPLAFYKPRKDQCTLCNNNSAPGFPENIEYEQHVIRKDIISINKAEDKKIALESSNTVLYATFDLQAVLVLPYAEDSQLYYSRKVSVFNFTVLDSEGTGTCFTWDETNGGRGSSEIGTCVMKHLKSLAPSIKRIIYYSDTCSGQNRNQYVVAALLVAINCDEYSGVDIIDYKFLESGHSMMEADSMHSTIERARESKCIYLPNEYALLFELARKNPRPYEVVRMAHNDFYNLHDLAEKIILNRSIDTEGLKVNWLQIKWLRFVRGSFDVLFKYDVEDEHFRTVSIRKGIRDDEFIMNTVLPLKQAHPERLPISVKKKQDLMNLIKKGVIPSIYAHYYTNLPTSKKVKDVAFWIDNDEEIEEFGINDVL